MSVAVAGATLFYRASKAAVARMSQCTDAARELRRAA
jgi:hypothetical protein